jgi:hypothetical protein
MNKFLQRIIQSVILLLSITVTPGFATNAESDNGVITGKVVNDSTSSPISYASVALLSATDSSLLTGVITDDMGELPQR